MPVIITMEIPYFIVLFFHGTYHYLKSSYLFLCLSSADIYPQEYFPLERSNLLVFVHSCSLSFLKRARNVEDAQQIAV